MGDSPTLNMATPHSIHSEALIVYALPVGMMLSDVHVKSHVLFKDLVAGRAIVFLGRHVLILHVGPHVISPFNGLATKKTSKSLRTLLHF